ncbi:MAG: flagellin [Verrucomicrobiota bacterium]|nr:flagellin [Verrucomicrobiota bacterium]
MHRYHEALKGANDSMQRLASGKKSLSVDDAGAIVVASKLDAKSARVDSARSNITNALSKVQTADGYLEKVANALNRMSELAALAMDNTKSFTDKQNYNTEFQDLKSYIRDVATRTMNGQTLFDGSAQSVISDSNGNFYSYNNANLTGVDVTDLTQGEVTSIQQWQTSINLWKVSKPGFTLNQTSYKTTQAGHEIINTNDTIWRLSQDMWYTGGINWSDTNNGGTKYDAGSFMKLGVGSGTQDIQTPPYNINPGWAQQITSKYATTTNPLAKGNLEAGDVRAIPSGTYLDYDPSYSSDPPSATTIAAGTFLANNPGLGGSQTAVNAGDYITVDPAGEDPARTYYAAGSTVTTDPTSVDAGATELADSHVLTSLGAKTTVTKINTALDRIATDRSSIGSVAGRMRRMDEQLGMLRENLGQSVSRMHDTDVAAESIQFSRHQILVKSSVEMLDKARIVNENVLRLLINNF